MARAGARLPEPGAHARDQLGEGERLRQVVRSSELQAPDLRLDVGERREDEDALIGAALQQIPKDGDPVQLWQEQVEHHQLVPSGLGQLERPDAVVGAIHLEPFRGERSRDEADDPRFVVDDQHPGHGPMLGPGDGARYP